MAVEDADDPFRPFRPRRGRYVTLVMAIVTVLVFIIGAIITPGPVDGEAWRVGDRIMFGGFGVLIAAFLLRYAMIRAVPTRTGLLIRNLLMTHRLDWSQVVAIQFAGGDPWLKLDLTDTDIVAVMAIQKADGPYARAEAARLAALLEALGDPGLRHADPAGP
ncbi:MAG: PH domain-containing protein [Nostocoides sp.]